MRDDEGAVQATAGVCPEVERVPIAGYRERPPHATGQQNMTTTTPTLFRLLLLPSVLTLLVSIARLVSEVQGLGTTQSGGAGFWLGISWLAPVFGGWFGWRLARGGSAPTLSRAWLWALVALLAIVGTAVWQFSQIDRTDRTDAAMAPLRSVVLTIVAVAIPMALLQFAVWRRLATALLLYGLIARATVVALTWLAKSQGWDTHYQKFGPGGIEVDMERTLVSATIAQLGFWVPFTIVTGTLVGCLVGGRRRSA